MRRGHALLYALIVVLLFTLIYVVNTLSEKEFDWRPNYRAHNKQPFGGYVLDKMLEASWEYEYKHSYNNLYRLVNTERLQKSNLLILANRFETSEADAKALFEYVALGNRALVAATEFGSHPYRLGDTLHFDVRSEGRLNHFLIQANRDTLKQQLRLSLCSSSFEGKEYRLPKLLATSHFSSIPDQAEILALKNDTLPVAIQYSIGEGKLILCTHPALFSNYGILSTEHEYVWGLLSYLNGTTLLRTEYYEEGAPSKGKAEFSYILSQRPLRWALYTTLVALALLIVFTAKRKQRMIPIVRKPDNQFLYFVRSIAALYLRKSDNGDILKKKYLLFAEQLQKDYHIDVVDSTHDDEMYERIARKTGADLREVKSLFAGLDLLDSDFEIKDNTLIDLIGKMDKIVKT